MKFLITLFCLLWFVHFELSAKEIEDTITIQEARELTNDYYEIIKDGMERRAQYFSSLQEGEEESFSDCFTTYDKGIRLIALKDNDKVRSESKPKGEFEDSLNSKFKEGKLEYWENPESINAGVFQCAKPIIAIKECSSCHNGVDGYARAQGDSKAGDILGALVFTYFVQR